jgi:hypothetical protein
MDLRAGRRISRLCLHFSLARRSTALIKVKEGEKNAF